MGADGFYFDSGHQPYTCYCKACKGNKKQSEEIIREAFLQFKKAVHAKNPECVLLISGRFEGLGHDLWRIADSPKIENHLPPKYGGKDPVGYSLGCTFIRDAADGKPAHCWRNNKTPVSIKEAVWLMTFGHVFNYDVAEEFLNKPDNISIWLQIIFAIILGLYIIYVLYFTFIKVRPWTRHEKLKKLVGLII